MNSTGRIGARAEGSTPSWMVRLLAQVCLVDDLDLARDAGAHIDVSHLERVTEADGVDGGLGAVAEGDDVAVGGEARAEPVGERQALLARAQQDLGRAQRAGRQHHDVCFDGRGRFGAAAVEPLEVHLPAAAAVLGQVAHPRMCVNLRAVANCVGEIGERHRVLGADVAAPATVAAARAGRLRDAGGIDAILEAHHHRRCHGPLAERVAGVVAAPCTWSVPPRPDRAPDAPTGPPAA